MRLSEKARALRPPFVAELLTNGCRRKESSKSTENDLDPLVRRGSTISLPSIPRPLRVLHRGQAAGNGIGPPETLAPVTGNVTRAAGSFGTTCCVVRIERWSVGAPGYGA